VLAVGTGALQQEIRSEYKEKVVRGNTGPMVSRLISASILAAAGAACLLAQATGSLSGVVFDPRGNFMSGAELQVGVPSGKVFRATTSEKGAYSVAGLPAGSYQVAVFVYGSRKFVQEGVAVGAGQVAKLDIHLKDDGQLGAIGDNSFAAAVIARKPVPAGPTPGARWASRSFGCVGADEKGGRGQAGDAPVG